MLEDIIPLIIATVVFLGGLGIVLALLESSEQRSQRFEEQITKFAAEQANTEQGFPLGDGAWGKLDLETSRDTVGNGQRRAVLVATLDPGQEPFPFSLHILPAGSPEQRGNRSEPNRVFFSESLKEQLDPQTWTQLNGKKSVFWALADGPRQAWLRRATITIKDRALRLRVAEEKQFDPRHANPLRHHLSQQIGLVKGLIEAIQQKSFIADMGARLAESPHRKERLHMLDIWLRENDPLPQPPPEFEQNARSINPEFWMLVLDNGGDPPIPMRNAIFARQDEPAQRILHTIMRRLPEERRRKYALAALNWRAHREAAMDMLGRLKDPALFPAIVAVYWAKPDDKLVELIAKHRDPAIVALMLELLERGPRSALLPAVEYLSRYGDRAALAPVINVRKQIPLFSEGKWEQAVNRMRRRLGPAPEAAGTLSLVTLDPHQGALSTQAAPDLAPAPLPEETTPAIAQNQTMDEEFNKLP